jgi:hypothetical protein
VGWILGDLLLDGVSVESIREMVSRSEGRRPVVGGGGVGAFVVADRAHGVHPVQVAVPLGALGAGLLGDGAREGRTAAGRTGPR